MYKILRGNGRNVGTMLGETDANFIVVLNLVLKMAKPLLTLKGYATPGTTEPAAPAENDCYLVIEAGTIWGQTVVVYNLINYNGTAWEVLPYKMDELNTALTPPAMDELNLLDKRLSSVEIDERLIHHADVLGTNNAEIDIRGNDNPTAASAAARQTLYDNYVIINYNPGYDPN